MRKQRSVKWLENLGRERLSQNFFLRDFLYSEVSQKYGIPNYPDDPGLAIEAGTHLCKKILEPLQEKLGHLAIRSGFRSCEVNQLCNEKKLGCSSNEANYAGHIWDRRDANGNMGATVCVVVTAFIPHYENTGDWQSLAWWIHDHVPHADLEFYPKLAAFNISWHETPARSIYSYIEPKGWLTKPGMPNNEGDHSEFYSGVPLFA